MHFLEQLYYFCLKLVASFLQILTNRNQKARREITIKVKLSFKLIFNLYKFYFFELLIKNFCDRCCCFSLLKELVLALSMTDRDIFPFGI